MSPRRRVPPMVRFDAKYVIDPVTGCWLWTAALDKDGYGKFGRSPDTGWWRAHKWRWEQDHGPVPEGMVLDHTCEVRRCVFPGHLQLTTSRGNTLRSSTAHAAINARKTHCVNDHPLSGENLHVDATTGQRCCRACRRAANIRYRQRAAEVSA